MNGPFALPLAFAAGLVSFLSPCTLPLLPGYLSYISGLGVEEIREGRGKGALLGPALLFVLGFSVVFVSLGATASYIYAAIAPYKPLLIRGAGVFIIVMALAMVGLLRLPFLYREKRFHVRGDLGRWGAFLLGMAFAFGWTPCIGPVLASISLVAATQGSAQRGALLLFVYALGLGLPFLLFAVFAGRALGSLAWFKRHYLAINRAGGMVLLVMGVFLVLNRWTLLLGPVLRWYANTITLPV